jgi:hypothetical protein
MQRILDRRVIKEGRRASWLFQNNKGVWDRFGMYDATFRQLLDAAREESGELLPEVVDTEDFSLWRSPTRGAVVETTNQGVSEKVIELIINQQMEEQGGSQRLCSGATHATGVHPSKEHSTYHACVLEGPLTRPLGPGGVICIYYI